MSSGRRAGTGVFVTLAALQWIAGPAAAASGSGGRPLGWAIITGMAVSAGLLAGYVTVAERRERARGVRDWLGLAVGPLLVALGLTAMGTAASGGPAVAGVAGGIGTVGAWAVSTQGDGGRRSEPTSLATLARHRAVEGTALAGAYVAGSAVGLLGTIVLAGHVTADTAAVGGFYGTSRLRCTGRAVLVQCGALAGAVGGLALVGDIPPVGSVVALALAGGVLVAIGGLETTTHLPTPRYEATEARL
jgi:hypothetical protein